MSMQDFYDEVKSSSSKDNFYLAPGANVVRLVSEPIKIEEAFCISKSKDSKTGEEKTFEGSQITYPGCGYEKYASAKFVVYAIDSGDQKNEDGTPKIKTLSFGWKVLEGLVECEKSQEIQGEGRFVFPMDTDAIISKNGKGQFSTSYAVTMMRAKENNKVLFTPEEIKTALSTLPTLKEWKAELIKETMARHAKFGLPTAKKQLEEEKASKGDAGAPEAVVQLNEPEDGSDFVEGEPLPTNGIPF